MGQIVKVYKDGIGYQVLNTDNIGAALEAGDNISIDGNEISAVDTTYSAGTGLSLSGTTFSLNVDYGADLSLSIDPSTFVLTAQLKNQNGGNIGTAQTIDLPLESVVVSGSYNAQTKEVELTLQSGSVIRFSVADLVSGLQEELVVGDGINIDANNEISVDTSVIATKEYVDDSIAESVSSGPTAPSNPTQGMLRYDTVNDVLKSYDGTQWNEVGNESTDINTKAFYLSGTSDLTNAQAAYDWFSAGKNPIVMYNNRAYLIYAKNATQLVFQDIENSAYDQTSYTEYVGQKIIFTLSGNDVTAINYNSTSGWSGPILRTDVNYSTPYTPTYAGSPTTKQYVDNNDTYIGASVPIDNVVEGRLWYDTTNDELKVYDGTSWILTGKVYTAGDHINISNADIISTTGLQEELVAGDNITIETYCHPDTQGPCPNGFHVPLKTEYEGLKSLMDGLGLTTGDHWRINLHMPFSGNRNINNNIQNQGNEGKYWTSAQMTDRWAWLLNMSSSNISTSSSWGKGNGLSIRPFKNSYITPDSSRTVIQGTLGSAGIFWNQTEGIISITNGTTGYTIADKNLGATIVYNDGDTLSEANCGKYYQWGNNYGFSRTGNITTSSTQVDASGYGPGNYYSSNVFIKGDNWSSTPNANLWGGVTNLTRCKPVISATDTTYSAGTGISIDANNVISSTQTNAEWGNITGTLSDQTDLQNALNDKANATDVLEKTNTTSYTPTGDYNPATKKYVDDAVSQAGGGDMLTTVYDPNGVGADAFDYTNFINTPTAGTGINITNNVISADTTTIATKSDLTNKQDKMSAGNNISIDGATINAKDTEYTAGNNVTITCPTESDMKGPSPSGFHIPDNSEFRGIYGILTNTLGLAADGTTLRDYLKMPYAGYRSYLNGGRALSAYEGYYCTSQVFGSSGPYYFMFRDGYVRPDRMGGYFKDGYSIRCFKNTPVVPDNTWTTLYDGSSIATGAGVFHNATLGLISVSGDGTTWTTIMDKNLGATTVYNNGNTKSEANCGGFFQFGNNYMFPYSGDITVTSTQVDSTGYGPGNYYYSSNFIICSEYDWSSVSNNNRRGYVTHGTFQDCEHPIISAAGGATYTAGTGININANNEISADTSVIATKQYVDDSIAESVSSGTTAPSNPTEGQLWYDTTNDVLKVYDGTNWNAVNTDTTYSAGTGLTLNGTTFSADTTVLATKQDIADLGSFEVVASLPSVSSANTKTIYLLGPIGTGADKYEEWIVTEDSQQQKQWTKIGETSMDLSGYATTSDLTTGLAAKQDTLTASTGINIDSSNNISNTLPGPTIAATAPTGTEGALWYDTTNDVLMAHDGTAWKEAGTQMKVLSYGHSTWQDFIDAYNENAIVYCKASSQSNPGSGAQGRMAFMAFIDINSSTQAIQGVEFQYYRSRSSHSTAATVLDEVYIYKLSSNGTWTVTQRDTAAKPLAGTGIGLTYNASGMTISADTTVLATQTDLNSKQDTLVSGTNIKTVNSNSLLGTGDITLNDVKVSATAPSSPTEGMVWYDTTNDVLKSYNGSAWVEVGNDSADINTKAFYLSSTSDLTTAQAAYDWYAAGKTPIIIFDNLSYILFGSGTTTLYFHSTLTSLSSVNNSKHRIAYKYITLNVSNDVVSSIVNDTTQVNFLSTDTNYSTPYTPTYNGSPATKKYVDDKSATVMTEAQYGQISSPTTGKIYFIKES